MGKLAFVFAGQGDQYPGMGKELVERYPTAAAVYRMCDKLRPGTSTQCLEGTKDQLQETEITQPCLFAMEYAAAMVLTERGIVPDVAAGFSLGEMVAAAFCGLFDSETAFSLVCQRGKLMQKAAQSQDTAMAAVLRLTAKQVQEACATAGRMYPVNFNCPGQITVAGLVDRMPALFEKVKALGGRAIPLQVRGGFHSPFMRQAAEDFAKELEAVTVQELNIPLYANKTAAHYTKEKAKDLLAQQICSPVLWEESVRAMIDDGVDTFVEIGPGRTLTNMIRKIDGRVCAKSLWECLGEE